MNLEYTPSRLNARMIQHLFGDISTRAEEGVRALSECHPIEFFSRNGYVFTARLGSCGGITFDLEPMATPGSTRIQTWVMSVPLAQMDRAVQSQCVFRYDVPVVHLIGNRKVLDYSLYGIRFNTDENVFGGDFSKSPMSTGYIGITGRHPFVRFREHRAKAISGQGHILHKTWHWLLAEMPGSHHAVFQFIGGAKDLDQAYEFEEQLVEAKTLTPRGLNAIPGGLAGIRTLHSLALLSGDRRPSFAERDGALERLEAHHSPGSKCSHYRSGHPRKLPTGRVTWVKPCWVNLKEVEAA